MGMEDAELRDLYLWLDEIPLSRPKRNISRDFSDGVLIAEVVSHFAPRLVELHNYPPASSASQKTSNWNTLNRRVFCRIGLIVPENVIKGLVDQKAGVIEVVLNNLRMKLESYAHRVERGDEHPEVIKRSLSHKSLSPTLKSPSAVSLMRAEPLTPAEQQQAIFERERTISDFQETISMLELKLKKLEQLSALKDQRIGELVVKLEDAGLA